VKELEYIHFEGRENFRSWLLKYHETSPGIWMIFYKKHVKIDCIKYDEALEEALCFGWIDSLIKKTDDDSYARKFTPRTNTKKWSEINKKKVVELVRSGKMTRAGLLKTPGNIMKGEIDIPASDIDKKKENTIEVPDFIVDELARNEPALKNFNNLASTYRKHYILWITNAKKEETVRRRLEESISLLKENKKLGLK
jgi:uncharacterized protein YdeI (YjbR/CyaY-like superfamily)